MVLQRLQGCRRRSLAGLCWLGVPGACIRPVVWRVEDIGRSCSVPPTHVPSSCFTYFVLPYSFQQCVYTYILGTVGSGLDF